MARVAETLVIALAVQGDRAAHDELIRRRQHGVRRFLRQLCGNGVLADDLAQQVFLRMWRSLGQLQSVDTFNGWLKKLIISVWFDELRHQRAAPDRPGTASVAAEPSVHATPGLERDLESALATLEPRTRLCVLLSYSEGHSHSEISGLLQMPLGTVKSTVTRGAEKLRALLTDYCREEGGGR